MNPLQRAAAWLSKVPPAVSGQNGHSTTYTAAVGLVHGFGLSEGDALSLLSDWNRSCQPPWSDRELIHKIRDAASKPHSGFDHIVHLIVWVNFRECFQSGYNLLID